MEQPEPESAAKKGIGSPRKASGKPARGPVERVIVWTLIVIGVGLVAIEARAKTGYDATLEFIQRRVDDYNAAGDGENAPELRLSEVRKNASGGPSVGAIAAAGFGEKPRTLKWWSLFKRYELILVLNNDSDEALVFNVRPADPDGE